MRTLQFCALLVSCNLVALVLAGCGGAPPGPHTPAARDIIATAAQVGHPVTPPFAFTNNPLYDVPLPPYGYPTYDTYGYTVEALNETVWIDYQGTGSQVGANIWVEMGNFNRMQSTDLHSDYWMDVVFDSRIRLWDNQNGHFEPNVSYAPPGQLAEECPAGLQVCIGPDDPCPTGAFPLMDVYASSSLLPNGSDTLLRTVYGGDMTNCGQGDPSENHAFTVLRDRDHPSEPAGRFHIPKALLGSPGKNCILRLRFVPRNLELPHYAPSHNVLDDGVSINITSVMVQLVAPPLVISHGWTPNLFPKTHAMPNQQDLKDNIHLAMRQELGQDPWEWATMPENGIYLNAYDRKQDFRVSADELKAHMTQPGGGQVGVPYLSHWTGKIWMDGHSIGGLVSRYYIEQLGGNLFVEKLSQTATPNTGSLLAVIYTSLLAYFYSQDDGVPNSVLGHFTPSYSCIDVILGMIATYGNYFPILYGWHTWWTASPGNVRTYHCGFSPGRSRMADFELLPSGIAGSSPPGWLSFGLSFFGLHNPVVHDMNTAYLASLATNAPHVPYFVVRGGLDATPNFDTAVTFGSASLNGAIPHRSIKASHETIPSQQQTAVYLARYFSDLNLDNGYPLISCGPHEVRVPHPPPIAVHNPGDDADPTASPDYVGNLTDNITMETFRVTNGTYLHFDNTTDEYSDEDGGAPSGNFKSRADVAKVANDPINIAIDSTGVTRIAIYTPLDLPALNLALHSPDGGLAKASFRENSDGWVRLQEFSLDSPPPGEYYLVVGDTAYATPMILIASWPSDHQFAVTTDKGLYAPGESIRLSATFSGLAADWRATISVQVPNADDPGFTELPLTADATGGFSAVWNANLAPGEYSFAVTADAVSSTGHISRVLNVAVSIA